MPPTISSCLSCCGLCVKALREPLMLAHHVGMAIVALTVVGGMCDHYAIFFFGFIVFLSSSSLSCLGFFLVLLAEGDGRSAELVVLEAFSAWSRRLARPVEGEDFRTVFNQRPVWLVAVAAASSVSSKATRVAMCSGRSARTCRRARPRPGAWAVSKGHSEHARPACTPMHRGAQPRSDTVVAPMAPAAPTREHAALT